MTYFSQLSRGCLAVVTFVLTFAAAYGRRAARRVPLTGEATALAPPAKLSFGEPCFNVEPKPVPEPAEQTAGVQKE